MKLIEVRKSIFKNSYDLWIRITPETAPIIKKLLGIETEHNYSQEYRIFSFVCEATAKNVEKNIIDQLYLSKVNNIIKE